MVPIGSLSSSACSRRRWPMRIPRPVAPSSTAKSTMPSTVLLRLKKSMPQPTPGPRRAYSHQPCDAVQSGTSPVVRCRPSWALAHAPPPVHGGAQLRCGSVRDRAARVSGHDVRTGGYGALERVAAGRTAVTSAAPGDAAGDGDFLASVCEHRGGAGELGAPVAGGQVIELGPPEA